MRNLPRHFDTSYHFVHLGMAAATTYERDTAAVVLTAELDAVVSMDVAAGQTLKVEAAAGAGKSTALRMYAERRSALRILYLTFTTAEASGPITLAAA